MLKDFKTADLFQWFFLLVELANGGNVNNEATLSSFIFTKHIVSLVLLYNSPNVVQGLVFF